MVWWTQFDKNAANVKRKDSRPADNMNHINRSLSERLSSKHYFNADPTITRLTPIMVTLGKNCKTAVEVKNLIESGMNIARLAISTTTMEENIFRLNLLREGTQQCCEKHNVNVWPVAVAVALCSGIKRSGVVNKPGQCADIKEGTQVIVTNDRTQFKKCNSDLIYIDLVNLTQDVKIGNEIIINRDEVTLVCTEIINNNYVLCRVKLGGKLHSLRIVTIKGAKYTAPSLDQKDLKFIDFAIENQLDMLLVPYVRSPQILIDIRKILKKKEYSLQLIASICTREGLEQLEEILQESDGIILAREYFTYEHSALEYRMALVQKNIAVQCRKAGKPMMISGHIMDSLYQGKILTDQDMFDIGNAIMDGVEGFVLKDYGDRFENLYDSMIAVASVCKSVEPILNMQDEFWRYHLEVPIPLNAAEACAMSSIFAARYTNSAAILVVTSSGATAKFLASQHPCLPVIAITTRKLVARRLNLYRGVIPYVFTDPPSKIFKEELDNRIDSTLTFLVNRGILTTGQLVIVLSGSTQLSAFCDMLQTVRVTFKKMLLWESCEEK